MKTLGQEAAEIKKIAHDIVFECQTRAHIGTDRLENLAAAMIDEGFDKIVSERGMVSGEQYAEIHRIAVEKDRLWSEACNERNALLRERGEQLKPWTAGSDFATEWAKDHDLWDIMCGKEVIIEQLPKRTCKRIVDAAFLKLREEVTNSIGAQDHLGWIPESIMNELRKALKQIDALLGKTQKD